MELDFSDDEAIQEAYSQGLLKPGLIKLEKSKNFYKRKSKDLIKNESGDEDENIDSKKNVDALGINDTGSLEAKLAEIQLPSEFHWVERLDLVNGLAPLAPEIAMELEEHREKREKEIKVITSIKNKKLGKKKDCIASAPSVMNMTEDDPVHNDFKREMDFYRQAQMAIMTSLPKLKELGIPTKRPADYFAEMAKSDDHMQKVAKVLLKKQTATEKAEKIRKVREQKKFAKQTQIHVQQERQKAKKELTENIKKYRKGQKNSLEFLEDKKSSKRNAGTKSDKFTGNVNYKRQMKNEKYGYGGKKAGSKWNTKDSLDEIYKGGGTRGGRGSKAPPAKGFGGKVRHNRRENKGGGSRDGQGGKAPPAKGFGGRHNRRDDKGRPNTNNRTGNRQGGGAIGRKGNNRGRGKAPR